MDTSSSSPLVLRGQGWVQVWVRLGEGGREEGARESLCPMNSFFDRVCVFVL